MVLEVFCGEIGSAQAVTTAENFLKKCSRAGWHKSILYIRLGVVLAFNTPERFFSSIRYLFDHAESNRKVFELFKEEYHG